MLYESKLIGCLRGKKKRNDPDFYSYLPENYFDKYKKQELTLTSIKEEIPSYQENISQAQEVDLSQSLSFQ